MSQEIPEGAPAPRSCRIRKWADYEGYGFNLQTQGSGKGQIVVKVDDGSPAQAAGLREDDRVVEVNGTNVLDETHQQVVARVRSVQGETEFLVVDREAEEFYRERNIAVSSSMANVVRLETPLREEGRGGGGGGGGAGAGGAPPSDSANQGHRARLCHLRTWPDFSGYGFNLHVEKDTLVHYVGKVDDASPAQSAALKEGDILIEVNGRNVQSSSHADVVRIIREMPSTVTLLVADSDANEYFKANNITVTNSSPFVDQIFCPDANPASGKEEEDKMVELTTADDIQHPFSLRLCDIKSANDGKGFGFNMQSEKNKPGQYIVKVDEGSPADVAGLKEGDFLVEVNGTDIEGFDHNQVVQLIKRNSKETKLLVADPETKKYFESKGIKMSSELVGAKVGTSPHAANTKSAQESVGIKHENKEHASSNDNKEKKELILDVKNIPKSDLYKGQTSPGSPPFSPTIIGGIEFAPTAEEARRRMAKKKQANQEMSLKAKFELFQKM